MHLRWRLRPDTALTTTWPLLLVSRSTKPQRLLLTCIESVSRPFSPSRRLCYGRWRMDSNIKSNRNKIYIDEATLSCTVQGSWNIFWIRRVSGYESTQLYRSSTRRTSSVIISSFGCLRYSIPNFIASLNARTTLIPELADAKTIGISWLDAKVNSLLTTDISASILLATHKTGMNGQLSRSSVYHFSQWKWNS